jgi:hypothetical protein
VIRVPPVITLTQQFCGLKNTRLFGIIYSGKKSLFKESVDFPRWSDLTTKGGSLLRIKPPKIIGQPFRIITILFTSEKKNE